MKRSPTRLKLSLPERGGVPCERHHSPRRLRTPFNADGQGAAVATKKQYCNRTADSIGTTIQVVTRRQSMAEGGFEKGVGSAKNFAGDVLRGHE